MSPEKVPMMAREKGSFAERFLLLFITALVLVSAGVRLFRGVDFEDEGYYSAVAYRFVLGDRPFADQILAHQTAFLLFTPLVWLFHWLTGGTQGLVLFLRLMFLGFNISIAALVYRVLRGVVDKNIALMTALFCIAFFGEWPTFCYNNLGALFLLVALMLQFHAVSHAGIRPARAIMGLAGLASAFSVISYPTMLLPVGVSVAVALYFLRSAGPRMFAAFAVGFFLGTVPVLAVAFSVGWTNVLSCVAATGRVWQAAGGDRVLWLLNNIWDLWFPNKWVESGVVIIAGLGILFRRSSLLLVLAAMVPLSLVGVYSETWGAGFRYLIKFCLWSPLLFLLLKEKFAFLPRLFWCVCVPSLVAGLTTAWTSANGVSNAGVGLVPAAFVTTLMLGLLLKIAFEANSSRPGPAVVAGMASVLLVLISFSWVFVYGEGRPVGLTARVQKGPYRGLATTPTKAMLCESLLQDLARCGGSGRVLFYDLFPGGYLFTSRRPASNTTWEERSTRLFIMPGIGDAGRQPDTVFEMKWLFNYQGSVRPRRYLVDDPLARFVHARYDLLFENAFYRVYARRTADPAKVQSIVGGNEVGRF
ncbi:MAG TPA: hypothetical protein VLT36_10450 [Candidatus Dormibacteraeota bacterium]|nr:hypothetical protein [Candidatus Dormibacteraeota bacterium]